MFLLPTISHQKCTELGSWLPDGNKAPQESAEKLMRTDDGKRGVSAPPICIFFDPAYHGILPNRAQTTCLYLCEVCPATLPIMPAIGRLSPSHVINAQLDPEELTICPACQPFYLPVSSALHCGLSAL